MAGTREFECVLQYTGGQLDFKTKNLHPEIYKTYGFGRGSWAEQYAVDLLEFSEGIKEFEEGYENAFTKAMDTEYLAKIFMHMLNAYTDKNNHQALQPEFREWCLCSFEEIQAALDEGSHMICNRCWSIVPRREMVVVFDDCGRERQVCKSCAKDILSQ